jgi:hypothetical protein
MVRERWPLLSNMIVCHFNEDFNLLYGSLEGAIAAAATDGSLEHRRAILKEWREWNATQRAADDIRRPLADGFSVAVHFKKPADARVFMDGVYETLLAGVKAETRQG